MKCDYPGCGKEATGGHRELIDARSIDFPNATIPGDETRWCDDHEDDLDRRTIGKEYEPIPPKNL
jgi:hypothetical protein